MADDAGRADWVRRVLGIDLSPMPQATAPQTTTPQAPDVQSISLKRLAMCRMAWRQVCGKIDSEVAALQAAVVAKYRADDEYDEDDIAEIEEATGQIKNWVTALDETIADMIDDIINAEPGSAREGMQRRAIRKADDLADFIESDPDFALVETNEFYAPKLKATALGALTTIRKELTNAQ